MDSLFVNIGRHPSNKKFQLKNDFFAWLAAVIVSHKCNGWLGLSNQIPFYSTQPL